MWQFMDVYGTAFMNQRNLAMASRSRNWWGVRWRVQTDTQTHMNNMSIHTVKMVEDYFSIAGFFLSEMCMKHCEAIGPPQKR